MVLSKTWNNTNYSIPQSGERGWASLTNFLSALADGAQSTGKQLIGRRTATVSPVTVTATTDCYVGINVASAVAAVSLPAGVAGQVFIIADESNAAATYNITITPNGANTINGTSSFVLTQNRQVVFIVFSGTNWTIVHNGSSATPVIAVTDSSKIDLTLTAGTLTADIIAGSLVNADINSSAAIARSKLASGTLNHVVINDGSGVMSSEAQLARTRGGTGVSSTATFPTSGIVVTEAAVETLTNKTLTAPTVSGIKVTDYEDYTLATVPSTPAASHARTYVSSVDGQLHIVSSAGVDTAIGAAGSSGKNYLQTYNTFDLDPSTGMVTNLTVTGNRAANTTVWGANTTSLLTQDATSKLRATNSAKLVNGSSSSNFIESPMFALDGIDVNTNQLFISFDMYESDAAAVAGDWTLKVIRYNSSGTYQETISPSIINIPTSYYSFKCAFSHSTTSTDQYAIRFSSATASSRTLYIDSLIVGPQQIVDANATGPWISFTPVASAGFGTVTNAAGYYRRVGDSMEIQCSWTTGTAAGSIATLTVPISLNIDSSKVSIANTSAAAGPIVGTYESNSANVAGNMVLATGTSTSLIYFASTYGTATPLVPANGSSIATNSVAFTMKCTIPISTYTSTVTVAQSPQIEYAFNTSATDAADTSSFGYGASGVVGVINTTVLTATRKKRIRFQNPIQPTDRIILEISPTKSVWQPLINSSLQTNLNTLQFQNGVSYGIGLDFNTVSSTDMDVLFGQYCAANGTTYGSAGTAWTSAGTMYWRVAKYSGVGLAELAPATATSVGSISRENIWTAYTPSFVGFGTPSSVTAFYKVLGDSLFVRAVFTSGTNTAATASVSLPSGFNINGGKIAASTNAAVSPIIGHFVSSSTMGSILACYTTSASVVYFSNVVGTNYTVIPVTATSLGSTTFISFQFEVPL